MEKATGMTVIEAIEKLNKAFLSDPFAQVDVITGATDTSDAFQLSAYRLIKAAQEGKKEAQEIDLEELKSEKTETTKETKKDKKEETTTTKEEVTTTKEKKKSSK